MHIRVWVITAMPAGENIQDPGEAGRRAREQAAADALRIIAHFNEEEIEARNRPWGCPAAWWDNVRTGYGDYANGEKEPRQAFRRAADAAGAEPELLPRVVVAPNGYPAVGLDGEDKQIFRSILGHWPDNTVVEQDWHY